MTSFINDGTTLFPAKTDAVPIGGNDPTKFVAAVDWNQFRQSLLDIQTWALTDHRVFDAADKTKYVLVEAYNGNPNGVLIRAKGSVVFDYTNAKIYQNQDGAVSWSVAGGSGTGGTSLTNANAGTIVTGTPVYNSAAGSFDKALGDTLAHARVIGLVQTNVATGATGIIQSGNALVATAAQWDAVAGTVGGLAFGTPYYLDPATAGKLTSIAPTTAGQFMTLVGYGLSPTTMLVLIQQPIGL